MSYIDDRLEFADAASAVASSGADTILGDYIDLGALPTIGESAVGAYPDFGPGTQIPIEITIITDLAGATAVVEFVLQTDTVSNFASPTDVMSTGKYTATDLDAGDKIQSLYFSNPAKERYMRVAMRVTTANITGGTIDCAGQIGRQHNEG
jgi:hypothetical protein